MPTMSKGFATRGLGAVAIASVLLLASACAGPSSQGNASGGDKPASTIRIGASIPLTGQFSEQGLAAQQGYKVWAAMVNDNGGLLGHPVEFVIKDDASDQNTVVADYNALISKDKVDLLIGTYSSLLNLPASAIAEKNQMLYIEPAGGSPKIFTRGFQYLFFAQQATAENQGTVFAKWISGLPADKRPKTAAYVSIDDPFVGPHVKSMKSVLEAAGVKTVYEQTYAVDTANFDTIVGALKSDAPDLVVHGAFFPDGVGLVRAMLRADAAPQWLYQTTAPGLGKQYADAIGAKNTEGIFYAVSWAPEAKTPGNDKFVAKYKEMFGGLPPEDSGDAYAAAQVLQAAVEAVKSTSNQKALADWLHANTVSTVLGALNWDEAGRPLGKFLIGQWQDGKVQFVLPDAVKTSDHIVNGWKPAE
jgi:branched-chain amino acid transport system substrate-binding protein